MKLSLLKTSLAASVSIWALTPKAALACAACFGQSNDRLAQGMNWGIMSLLVMIVGVLGGIASFFVYIAKKSSAVSSAEDLRKQTAELSTKKIQ